MCRHSLGTRGRPTTEIQQLPAAAWAYRCCQQPGDAQTCWLCVCSKKFAGEYGKATVFPLYASRTSFLYASTRILKVPTTEPRQRLTCMDEGHTPNRDYCATNPSCIDMPHTHFRSFRETPVAARSSLSLPRNATHLPGTMDVIDDDRFSSSSSENSHRTLVSSSGEKAVPRPGPGLFPARIVSRPLLTQASPLRAGTALCGLS